MSLKITDASNAPSYRIALRSLTNDWDSVYTVSSKTPTIAYVGNSSTVRYVSVAAVNAAGAESLFLNEVAMTVPTTTEKQTNSFFALERPVMASAASQSGINVLPNYPNPFDESTYVVLKNDSDAQYNNAYLTIRKADDTVLEWRKVQIRSGINEYIFSYKNERKIETFYYTFEVDGQAMGTNRMMTRY